MTGQRANDSHGSNAQDSSDSQASGGEDRAIVVVSRCDEGPPSVPARVTTCSDCGADCWMSLSTGAALMDAALDSGAPVAILCRRCATPEILGADEPVVRVVPSVLKEAAAEMGITPEQMLETARRGAEIEFGRPVRFEVVDD